MKFIAHAVSAIAIAFFTMTAPASASVVTPLGRIPGTSWTDVFNISSDGSTLVGYADYKPFYYTQAGGFTQLGLMDGSSSGYIQAVSTNGSVIVGYNAVGNTNSTRAVVWNNGGVTKISDSNSIAYGVSSDGSVIVGIENGIAFRWTATTGMVKFGGSNSMAFDVSADGNIVLGYSFGSGGFRWNYTTASTTYLGTLSGYSYDQPEAISADGSIVAGKLAGNSSGTEQAFRWTLNGGMVGLGVLPGQTSSYVMGMSDDGSVIVGLSGNTSFVWTPGNGMQDLRSLLTSQGVDMTGWSSFYAFDVSADNSTIVGVGTFNGAEQPFRIDNFTASAVPEPAPGFLMSIGGAVLLFHRIRRRRKVC